MIEANLAIPAFGTALGSVQDNMISSGMLTPENGAALRELGLELTDAWEKRQVHRTEYEMRVSVLNDGKFPTAASKYWQAVREQANMLDNLILVGFEYRRNEVEIRRIESKLSRNALDDFDRELLLIDLDECLFKRAGMQQAGNDRTREIKLWSALKSEADDGSFDTADVNTHQLESMYLSLQNRRAALVGSHSSQAEVINVTGPLNTAARMLRERAEKVLNSGG